MKRALRNLTIVVASIGAALAHADVMYTYAGQDFTYVNPNYPAIWTTHDSISGNFTLDTAPASMAFGSITPKSFSFTAGSTTITGITPLDFEISTAADGSILEWNIVLEVNVPGGFQVLETQHYGSGNHAIQDDTAGQCVVACFDSEGSIGGNDPTNWALSTVTPPSSVPEPTAISLLALVGLGTAIVSREQKPRGTTTEPI